MYAGELTALQRVNIFARRVCSRRTVARPHGRCRLFKPVRHI